MTIISIIAAMGTNRVIGVKNTLPWHIPEELQNFKNITMGKPMIMGRKTFDAIGRRLLPGRKSIILTRDKDLIGEGFYVANDLQEALDLAGDVPEVMIVGGANIYKEFLPIANRMYLSFIPCDVQGDAFFPDFDLQSWKQVSETVQAKYTLKIFERNVSGDSNA